MSGAAGGTGASAAGRTLVKICGITREKDALDALEAGADALGFVLAEGSKRHMSADDARSLADAVRARAGRPFLAVAVLDTVDAGAARRALETLYFDRVQLHGRAEAAGRSSALAALGPLAARTWAVAHVSSAGLPPGDHAALPCEAVLLDTDAPGAGGGSGVPFDWVHAVPLARVRRIVLAGGLTPETVAEAVRAIGPWMVDVSSGVESAPGIKDRARVRAFLEAVRHVHA